MIESIKKIPRACHYIYFHTDDEKEIRNAWNSLIQEYDEKEIKGDVSKPEKTEKTFIPISFVIGDRNGSYLSCFQNIAIIGLLFFSEDLLQEVNFKNIEEKRNKIKESLSYALGEGTVLIVEEEEQIEIIKDQFPENPIIESELSFGKLYHSSRDSRNYYFCIPSKNDPLLKFLIEDLPIFDANFQSLDKKVKFFQDQRQLMEKERMELDKFVGKILYRGIGKKESDLERIEILEEEINNLSTTYEKMANYIFMTKNAQNTIKDEMGRLEEHLSLLFLEKPLESKYLKDNKEILDQLKLEEGLLSASLEGTKTAIDVVATKVGLLRGRESLTLQKQTQKLQEEGLTMQMAASFIEFIIVFYYTLSIWKIFLTEEVLHHIPVLVQFTLVALFSFAVVICTHYVAVSWREHWKINRGIVITSVAIALLVISMAAISLYYLGLSSH